MTLSMTQYVNFYIHYVHRTPHQRAYLLRLAADRQAANEAGYRSLLAKIAVEGKVPVLHK